MAGVQILDGTSRHRNRPGSDLTITCLVGCYARHTVVNEASVIPVDPSFRPEAACLTGCGVATGWGSSVYAGGVRPGDAVAVVGAGGLGSAAVQGARLAGARHIFAIDPVEFKRTSALGFGATHTATDVAAAYDLVREVTWGRMCDVVVLTMGTGRSDLMDADPRPGGQARPRRRHEHLPGDRHQARTGAERARAVGEADRGLHLRLGQLARRHTAAC